MPTHSPARLGVGLADTLRHVRDRGAHGSTGAVPTGFTTLDQPLGGGIRRGELTVVAGRSGMGATMFVLGLLRNAALRHRFPVLGIAPGQVLSDLHLQVVSAEARVPLHHLRHGLITDGDWRKITRCTDRIEAAPIWLDTTGEPAVDEVADAVAKVHARDPVALVVIDGIENLRSEERSEPPYLSVARTVERLRTLARHRHLAVVVTCHLDRSARADHYPSLADVRDDGDLDAVADTILLLHRDDVYDPNTLRPGEADVIIAKNRGPTHTIGVHFQGHYARFVEPQ